MTEAEEESKKMLVYYQLLHAYVIPIIAERKNQGQNKRKLEEIESMQKQIDVLKEQIFKLKKRIIDVKWLSILQTESDIGCANVNKDLELTASSNVNQILRKLNRLLKTITGLRCQNIKPIESEEDSKSFLESIEKCSAILQDLQLHKVEDIFKDIESNSDEFGINTTCINKAITELTKTINELQFLIVQYTTEGLGKVEVEPL